MRGTRRLREVVQGWDSNTMLRAQRPGCSRPAEAASSLAGEPDFGHIGLRRCRSRVAQHCCGVSQRPRAGKRSSRMLREAAHWSSLAVKVGHRVSTEIRNAASAKGVAARARPCTSSIWRPVLRALTATPCSTRWACRAGSYGKVTCRTVPLTWCMSGRARGADAPVRQHIIAPRLLRCAAASSDQTQLIYEGKPAEAAQVGRLQ